MPTVIDSLVVELGLDPKKFNLAQTLAVKDLRKFEEEVTKQGKKAEAAGERGAQFFNKMRNQALGFLGLLMGGVGLKQFIQNVTTSDAAVGRLSRTIGTSTEMLSSWQGAAAVLGGDAKATGASIQGLVNQFEMFAVTGQSQVIPYFRALGVHVSDAAGKMRPFEQILLDLADAFQKMEPSRARTFGLQLGLDDGTINLLLRGRDAISKLLAEQKALAIVTKQNADQAEALAKSWNEAGQAAEGFGREILNQVTPALKGALSWMTSWFTESNRVLQRSEAMTQSRMRASRRTGGGGGPVVAPDATGGGLRLKRGATGGGDASLGTLALAQQLQAEIPELSQFTALNDKYHMLLGRNSQHTKGLALDFTLSDTSKSAKVAEQVRNKLKAMGVEGTVIDEYLHPSRGSTGGHIHVNFANAAAASRYAELSRGAGTGSKGGDVVTATTTIGTITVNTQATDAAGIARDLGAALGKTSLASQAQTGPS